ncbi:uncharacterized protein BO80DRAFT_162236 [Aspergillus ibericus CBS 121593]|uniref:Uncharacterized protein n=1 Tax=Aspergillus ibericus CBS 121593 TaxID=1448316 RepID=A0A395GUQ7_9EURO|nr:hypothetical protein BO80DRAFT_162236 [Aspergillus ibericus CBS 121593]RAK98397.1 hypothetical protein BO80DRAFT_162236 [Aspergillus ibericus CBS 121593]
MMDHPMKMGMEGFYVNGFRFTCPIFPSPRPPFILKTLSRWILQSALSDTGRSTAATGTDPQDRPLYRLLANGGASCGRLLLFPPYQGGNLPAGYLGSLQWGQSLINRRREKALSGHRRIGGSQAIRPHVPGRIRHPGAVVGLRLSLHLINSCCIISPSLHRPFSSHPPHFQSYLHSRPLWLAAEDRPPRHIPRRFWRPRM